MNVHKSAQSNKADTNDVELITRWEAGETHYSVDGGEHWWTKEQFKYIQKHIAQETNKAVINKLEDVMVKVDYTDSDTLITQKALRTHNNIQRELSQLTADKEQA